MSDRNRTTAPFDSIPFPKSTSVSGSVPVDPAVADGDSAPLPNVGALDEVFSQQTRGTVSCNVHSDDCSALDFAAVSAPDRFGRYRVIRRIGRGGFGTVYLGYDELLGRDVAVKVAHVGRQFSREEMDSYLREARALASIDHPNVVPIFDVGRDGDSCFLISKYIDGGNLDDRRTQFDNEAKIASVVRTIAIALGHLHVAGFVHRDIKPANILIDRVNCPYLTDFGLAIHEKDQTSGRHELAGTLAYMAPEQFRQKVDWLDGRTDIWALGVILYELLTNRIPFAGRNKDEIEERVAYRDPKPPRQINPRVSASIESACLTALRKSPADRFSTALDFANALQPQGQTTKLNYFALSDSDLAHRAKRLERIPRGPMLRDSPLFHRVERSFCEMFPTYHEARNMLEQAVALRLVDDANATHVKPYDVMGESGSVAGFWADVFREARKHGPRMVGALLLAVPREKVIYLGDSAMNDHENLLANLEIGD